MERVVIAVLILLVGVEAVYFLQHRGLPAAKVEVPEWIQSAPLPVNPYSRPGTPLETISGVVIHYVGNPATSAEANRSYFAGLALTGETCASSHFLVGLDGEILQCIPLTEIAYCSNERNSDTVSIEVCHEDETGEFSEQTLESLMRLTAWLCVTFDLDAQTDVIRHYDVTGKICPKYYVEHEDAWLALKDSVQAHEAEFAKK